MMLRSGTSLLPALSFLSFPWRTRKVSLHQHVPIFFTPPFPFPSESSMLISTVRQLTPEIKSCGVLADFGTPFPSSSSMNSTALQGCIQRIAATKPDVAIRYAYSYALYTSTIALAAELGMPRPMRLREGGFHGLERRVSRKKRLGSGRLG